MSNQISENGKTSVFEINSNNNLVLRSMEVNELISSRPGFLVRWGITIFLLILILISTLTFFISYPDTVLTKARLTSVNAPKEVKVKTSGKLIKLNTVEGIFAQRDQVLGLMESQANHYEVIFLSQKIDSLQILLNNNQLEIIPKLLSQPYQNLGEVQQAYQTFMQSYISFKQYLASGYFLKRKAMLQKDFIFLQHLHANLVKQKNMQLEDLDLAKETFDANSTLKDEKVISPLDFRIEKSKYISKALSIPVISSAIISNESSQNDKLKEIIQLDNEIYQQKVFFAQVLNTLKSHIDEWKNKYLLTAPIEGKVVFSDFIQQNQQLYIDQTFCFINPENTSYFAEVYIPQNNLGKIKQGQRVLLKLPSYPFQEYGYIEGELNFISNIATDSGYTAKVILPKGLNTNYNKKVQYRDGLLAQGEIITADMKLSDRLMNRVKRIFNK